MRPRSQTLVSNIGIRMTGLRLQVRRIANPFPKHNIRSRNFTVQFSNFYVTTDHRPKAQYNIPNVKFVEDQLVKKQFTRKN